MLRTPVTVVVSDGLVKQIADGDGPADTGQELTVVDASGATIVPGLVDCHSHLTLGRSRSGSGTAGAGRRDTRTSGPREPG